MLQRASDEAEIGIAQRTDLAAVRALIIAGLTQRWRSYSASKNPDLEAFESTYASAVIVIAKVGDEIVGCGILVPEAPKVGRIVRMSVATVRQRTGIGGRVLRRLLDEAVQLGHSHVVLETSADWDSAISFYERHGFAPTEQRDGDQHFRFDLQIRG
jgi:GNAT superfamily N-acetyltransferase